MFRYPNSLYFRFLFSASEKRDPFYTLPTPRFRILMVLPILYISSLCLSLRYQTRIRFHKYIHIIHPSSSYSP